MSKVINKTELVADIHAAMLAKNDSVSKTMVKDFVDTFTEYVTNTLKAGDSVQIIGFGMFTTTDRASKKGVNPRTGESIDIPARRVPKFVAGKELKRSVSND